VVVTAGSYGDTHNGNITLRSAVVFQDVGGADGRHGTFNGKITGSGKLLTMGNATTNRLIVLNNPTNNYSGGTEVLVQGCRAGATNSLGTGPVHVDTNAWLFANVSGVMTNTTDLYLDSDGVTYGHLYMGTVSVTTTVNRAFVGGKGGWEAPSGYTQLASGNYTSNSLPSYLAGNGVLKVTASAKSGMIVFFR